MAEKPLAELSAFAPCTQQSSLWWHTLQAPSPGHTRAMPVRRGWDWKRSVRRQADLGRVLVGIRQWRRDAHGALADIAQEQAAARCTQRVLDAQLDAADKRQQEEVRCVWLVQGCWGREVGTVHLKPLLAAGPAS